MNPREYFLVINKTSGKLEEGSDSRYVLIADKQEQIHVIEYSAYEALLKTVATEVFDLTEKNKILREALELYADKRNLDDWVIDGGYNSITASEALKNALFNRDSEKSYCLDLINQYARENKILREALEFYVRDSANSIVAKAALEKCDSVGEKK